MNRFFQLLIAVSLSFGNSGIAQHSGVSHPYGSPVYSLSINKSKMSGYLEPIPGAGFIKTDHEFIYFWRMNAAQIATWLEKRTGYCIKTGRGSTSQYYSFSIPNHANAAELIPAFRYLGVSITFNGHVKNK